MRRRRIIVVAVVLDVVEQEDRYNEKVKVSTELLFLSPLILSNGITA